MKKEKMEITPFCEEETLKQITKIFHDPKHKKDFEMFPYFEDIAKFLAIDYQRANVPEILEHTTIKAFGMEANMDGLKKEGGSYSTGALGFSYIMMDDRLNKPFKERVIRINQNYYDRHNFDFKDFTLHVTNKYGTKFDKIRREEVSGQDAETEMRLFGEGFVMPMDAYDKMIHQKFSPRVRLKKGFKELFEFLENGEFKDAKTVTPSKEEIRGTKETLTHEFLHSITHRRGLYWGGVSTAHINLHEGMTEYLTAKTIANHKEFYMQTTNKKPRIFPPYKPYVAYVNMMELLFPGSVADVYFNGKSVIKKYKVGDYSLQCFMDDFAAIQYFSDLEVTDKFEDKQYFAHFMIKSLLNQKHIVAKLLNDGFITKKQQSQFMDLVQTVYDGSLKNRKLVMDFDFKNEDKEFSQNKLKKQRKEFYALAKK